MSGLLDTIRSKGYWRVVIRPNHFVEQRVEDIAALKPILEKSSVRLRGWDFPHVNGKGKAYPDRDSIAQEFEWKEYHEFWRFYQSGQFIYYGGFVSDWRESASDHKGVERHKTLRAVDMVVRFTEVFEFAARLALTQVADTQTHIEIKASGLKDRSIWFNPEKYDPWPTLKAHVAEFRYEDDVPNAKLMAESRELALVAARELFKRFDWDPNLDVLRDMQAMLQR